MLRNYLLIAWRNLRRHKGFSAINIFGLAIGIAACLLILQYVRFELSYDDFHAKAERVYRVRQDRYNDGKLSTQWAAGAYAAGNSFKSAFGEIEAYVKLRTNGPMVITRGAERFKVEKPFHAGAQFFNVFSYPLLSGDPRTALNEPNTVVLSEAIARQFFPGQDPLGKTLRFDEKFDYRITGVFRELPANTHLKFDVLISFATFEAMLGPDNSTDKAWQWDGCLTYLLLRPGTDPKLLEAKFPKVVDQLAGEEHKQYNSAAIYLLQPLRDIHLYSHYMGEAEANGDGNAVYLLLGIAFFIVVIAWVNYVNLATARAINRAKEVGIRKVVGSNRQQLVKQFLFESALLNALAVGLALVLVVVALPFFNRLSGQQMGFSLLSSAVFWGSLVALYVTGTLLSGLYPAFVLSSFMPVTVLKGKLSSSRRGVVLRQSLVVFQFAASLFLLVGTFTVFRQIQFMRSQNLGIQIDQTLVINSLIVRDSTFLTQLDAFKDEMRRLPGVRKIAVSTSIPGEPAGWNAGGIRLKGTDEAQGKQYRVIGMDYDYLDAYGLKLLTGRKFSKAYGTDPQSVIFNKMAVQQLGFDKPEEAIGKEIEFWGKQYTIIGVADNYHQQSLREAYEPLIFRLIPDASNYFSVKVETGQLPATMAGLQKGWNAFFPGNPFEYFFLDDHFDAQYQADRRFGQVFGLFTGLAILVACLGLFGLASFTTMQRTKEIGVRKVLGASVRQILQLLYKDFAVLVVLAFVVAVPVSWYATHRWLQTYAFRIEPEWWLYALPFGLVLLVALLTVSYQTLKAALANPVNSLRSE
jgi:putative ABC transport system permease protein